MRDMYTFDRMQPVNIMISSFFMPPPPSPATDLVGIVGCRDVIFFQLLSAACNTCSNIFSLNKHGRARRCFFVEFIDLTVASCTMSTDDE
jgi:hypothetical protein